MFRISNNRVAACLLAFGLSLYLLALSPQPVGARMPAAARPAAARTDELSLDHPVAKNLSGREVHDYVIAVRAGQYLRAQLEPEGIELIVTLTDPAGLKLLEVECQPDANCVEPLAVVTGSQGKYHLGVRAKNLAADKGRYTLRLEVLRDAAPHDAECLTAQRALARGRRLQFGVGTPTALHAALAEYKMAYNACQLACDVLDTAYALDSMAGLQILFGELEDAANSYERELALLRAPAGPPQQQQEQQAREASVAENVGWFYFNSLADKPRALEHLERALQFYDEASVRLSAVDFDAARTARFSAARARMLIGQVYNELGTGDDDRQQAVAYFNAALTAERELRNPYAEGDLLAHLMVTWKNLRQPTVAIFFGKQAVSVYQTLRARIKDAALEPEAQQTFIRSKTDTYRILAALLLTKGRLRASEEVLDMLKEEELSELLRAKGETGGAGNETKPTLSPAEAELQRQYQANADQILLFARQLRELKAKPSRTADEERLFNKLNADLNVANKWFNQLLARVGKELKEQQVKSGEIDEKQLAMLVELNSTKVMSDDLSALGNDVAALYTLVGAEKLYIILITRDGHKAAEYPIKAQDLAQKVLDFRAVLRDKKSDPLPLAKELYNIIIGKVAKDLEAAQAHTLMWSLDGVLRYVPMAALHDGQGYLLERYCNTVFTNRAYLKLANQPAGQWQGVGFGVSKEWPDFLPLPAVPGELRAIFRGDAPATESGSGVLLGRAMLDNDFTLDSLNKALERPPAIVHVASHFVFSVDNDTSSFLLLGDGHRLPLGEIQSSDAINLSGVELLTLSACDTALSDKGRDGKEVDGLAMVAQYKGAKAVIGSLWRVADESTCMLMQKFYEILETQKGMPKGEALRQAQLALRRGAIESQCDDSLDRLRGVSLGPGQNVATGGRFAHPFYWAPFTLTGNWK